MKNVYKVIYKVIYSRIDASTGCKTFGHSVIFTDKEKAVKQCEDFAQTMRNIDYVVSQYDKADYYIWIREYADRDGVLQPIAFYPYESIEDGVLKTPHLSVHHEYFSSK